MKSDGENSNAKQQPATIKIRPNLKARTGVSWSKSCFKITEYRRGKMNLLSTISKDRKETDYSSVAVRWNAIVRRDHNADGKFYYSVKTTGVYCRPSCAARLPRPENVQFHLTCEDAEKAGFRPCKRCKPSQAGTADQTAKKIAKVCRL